MWPHVRVATGPRKVRERSTNNIFGLYTTVKGNRLLARSRFLEAPGGFSEGGQSGPLANQVLAGAPYHGGLDLAWLWVEIYVAYRGL